MKKPHRTIKMVQGFTLIELLIVVAVIAILAAIAIPQYASYKTKSANANAIGDLHNIKVAMEAFYTDKTYYPSTLTGH